MAGLVPAIHVFLGQIKQDVDDWHEARGEYRRRPKAAVATL
jgi:hypothetical protein